MAKKKVKNEQYPELIYIDRWGWEDDDGDWNSVTILEKPEDAVRDIEEDGEEWILGVYKFVKTVRVKAQKKITVEDMK